MIKKTFFSPYTNPPAKRNVMQFNPLAMGGHFYAVTKNSTMANVYNCN